jgi:curli production assembly/transport component CsgG
MCVCVSWKGCRIAALLGAIALGGCGVEAAKRQLDEGIMPPVLNPMTELNLSLRELPPPNSKIVVAVYNYADQTGQFKPIDNVQSLSKAVTQGATSVIIKALQDAGNGSWFTVVEREKLDNLLKERRIIAEMRKTYLGEENVNPQALPPLLFAGILLEGGIIGYDSNLQTGGIGARLLGIGGDVKYRLDTITIYLRAVSTKNGQVLANVVTHKTIASIGLQGGVFKYIAVDKILDAEAGFTKNEPEQLAVQQAIEKAVYALVVEGADQGLWSFSDKGYQMRAIDDYRAQLFSSRAPAAQGSDAAMKVAAGDGAGEVVTQSTAATTPAVAGNAPQPRAAAPAAKSATTAPARRAKAKTAAANSAPANTAATKPPAKDTGGSGFVTMLTTPAGEASPAQAQN